MYFIQHIYKKLLHEPSGNLLVQIFRSVAAGFVAFSFDYLTLFLLTEYAHVYYLTSTIGGFMVGLSISYVLNIKWVFNHRKVKNVKLEILIFGLISAIGLGFTYGFMWLFTDILSLHYMFSKIITTAIVFIWNFAIKKITLFINDK
jgi:putative flippase GtrA